MKIGFSPVILAKLSECVTPVLLLIVLWRFVRKNYGSELAFFTLIAFSSSFAFFLSLINHIPATIAFIFAFLALGQLFQRRLLRAALLVALCFYTHIGVSWFLCLSLILYAFLNKQDRKDVFTALITGLILSIPVLWREFSALKNISVIGINLNERYLCQIKALDYIFAALGLTFIFRMKEKYWLFFALFLSSFIFLIYPYRFFAEGYLAIIFLSAVFFSGLYQGSKSAGLLLKAVFSFLLLFIIFFSPTLSMDKTDAQDRHAFKIKAFDSALTGLLFAKGGSIWFPDDYVRAASFIKDNSGNKDIIYCSINVLGPALASISGRATANALFPEIKPEGEYDPIAASRLIIFARDEDPEKAATGYGLKKIGEDKLFIYFKNPVCGYSFNPLKAAFPFWEVFLFIFVFIICLIVS